MYQCGEMFPAHDDAFPAMRFADGRHNPYGVTVTKSNHVLAAAPPEYAASHTWSSASSEAARQHTPAAQPHKFHARRSEATSFHSKFLAGSCEFVAIPAGADDGTISSEDPMALAEALRQSQKLPQPLFVGQLRFEMTAGELRWLLRHLAGIHALKVEPRGPGCFVVVCRSEADADAALRLNRRVLFDYRGVWVARTDAAALAVESRVAMLDPQLSRRTRLPRDAMVVERQRGSLNPLRQVCFQSLIETVPVTFERCEAPLGGSSGSSLNGLSSSESE